MQFSARQREILLAYVHEGAPLGPIDAAMIEDAEAREALFETSSALAKLFAQRPTIIIGRKGAGKTAFLDRAGRAGAYDIVVHVRAHEAFAKAVRLINSLVEEQKIILVEEIADIWRKIFYSMLASEISKLEKAPKDLSSYVQILGIATRNEEGLWGRMTKMLSERNGSDNLPLFSAAFRQIFKTDDPNILREIIHHFLRDNKLTAVILVDTLEDYQIDSEGMRYALSGLLRCVGEFGGIKGRPEMRFCLPVELVKELNEISSNALKDFRHRLFLHWHGMELLSLVAYRYQIYLELHHAAAIGINPCLELDVAGHRRALEFFRCIAPREVTNSLGVTEDTLAYVLRHTQLLPRQILYMFAQIIEVNLRRQGNPWQLSESDIKAGVAAVEGQLWREVCNGFRLRHPAARSLCEGLLPELPRSFSDGELHETFNRTRGLHDGVDYHGAKRTLVEIGALGIVTETNERYIRGKFEYTVPGSLLMPSFAQLCVHPMFRNGFQDRDQDSGDNRRVVHPLGADPNEGEFRDFS